MELRMPMEEPVSISVARFPSPRRTSARTRKARARPTIATMDHRCRGPSAPSRSGWCYDLAVNPKKNVMLTSSFTRELHAAARRPDQGRSGDEELRQHDGRVGPEGDEADERHVGPGR